MPRELCLLVVRDHIGLDELPSSSFLNVDVFLSENLDFILFLRNLRVKRTTLYIFPVQNFARIFFVI